MNRLLRYCFIITLFITTFCYGLTKGNNNIQVSSTTPVKSEFNLNTRYNGNHYSAFADDNFAYDPIYAKQQCPGIADQIIADIPPEQNPYLKPSDCDPNAHDDIHVQMMGGCDPDIHGEFGKLISNSVVNIDIPTDTGRSYCSGTVIGQKWVLSAAHCFTNVDNYQFYSLLKTHPVVINNQYIVKTIYITKNYNLGNGVKSDLAVLELEMPLPSGYKPIKLATDIPPSGLDVPVWSAGYGGNRKLRYRKQYYMTNIYDSKWPGIQYGIGNLNELYISGTKPTLDVYSGKEIAWSFQVSGDSGGPALLYNLIKQEFSVLGITSYAIDCNKTAFLANTPYNYSVYTSVPAYYHFIQSVITKTMLPDTVNSITYIPSTPQSKKFSIFSLSSASDYIAHYYINQTTKEPVPGNVLDTDGYPTAVAATTNYAYVTNFMGDSISEYRINKDSTLSLMIQHSTPDSNPTDIKIIKNYAFITMYNKNQLSLFDINSLTGGLSYLKSFDTGSKPFSIATTIVNNNHYIFVANAGSNSISAYKFISATERLEIIDKNIKLSKFSGMPLKILADGPYIFIQGTKGIYLYTFNGDEIIFKKFLPIDFDPGANSDMILLPGIKPPFALLAVSTGNSASLPVGIYSVDYANSSIKFNTSLLIRGTGLAAYLDATNNIILYIANSSIYKQRTLSMIEIHPQKNIEDKVNFTLPRDFRTIDNPTKLVIEHH